MKLEQKLALALTDLRATPAFRVFMEAMKEDERVETQRSLQSEGATCHRAQGAVLKLQELQRLYADAPAMLEKFKQVQ